MTPALILPPSGLVRVIYTSRWGAVACEDLHHIVRAVVAKSTHNNRLCEVTGLLLVGPGWFLQMLEGPVDNVRQTFARIAQDRRHFDIQLLGAGPTDRRLLPDTNMAERRLEIGDYAELRRLGLAETFAPAQLEAERALQLITSLASNAWSARAA